MQFTRFFFTLVTVLLLFTACQKDEQDDCEPIDNPDCVCTQEYAPVCGCDGVTYSNACVADCHGVDIVREGSCE